MTNKIILQRTVTQYEPDIYVAAYDALPEHRDQANFLCDGVDDDIQIQAAIDKLGSLGGTIALSEGHFNTSNEITGKSNITIFGKGRESTIITQTTSNTRIFNFDGDNEIRVSNLKLSMPTTDSGDAVYCDGTSITLDMLRLKGGTSEMTFLNLQNCFEMEIKRIKYDGAIGNGILIENSDNAAHYGNGSIKDISFSMKANCTGIKIVGYDGGKTENLVAVRDVNVVTGVATPNGIKGIHLNNSHRIAFEGNMDFEQLDYTLYLENATLNNFQKLFSTAWISDLYMDDDSVNNQFYSFALANTNFKLQNDGYKRRLSQLNEFTGCNPYFMNIKEPAFFDDFVGAALNESVWKKTGTVSIANSKAVFTTGATTGDKARIDFNNNPCYDDSLDSILQTKLNRVSSGDYDVKFGLVDNNFETTNKGAFFRANNDDTNWQCVNTNGTSQNVIDTGVAVDDTPHTFVIWRKWYSVFFVIDWQLVGDNRTYLPSKTTKREPVFEITTQEDAAKILNVDYVYVDVGRSLTA